MTKPQLPALLEAARRRADGRSPQDARRDGPRPAWLLERRARALEEFERLGLPSTRDEEWKFTDAARIGAVPYVPAEEAAPVDSARLARLAPDLGGPRIVLVDGIHRPDLDQGLRVEGARIGSVSRSLLDDEASLAPRWGDVPGIGPNPFVALNGALTLDGAVVDVAPRTVIKQPVHIVHVATAARSSPSSSHARNLVRVGPGAEATVVESYVTLGEGPHFTNPVTELRAGAASHVRHVKLLLESPGSHHVAAVHAVLERDARLEDHSFTLGGGLVRNDVHVRFEGEGAEATLNGLYLVGGTQHVDNHTSIDHAVPHCTSNEFYKGILDDRARGVFYGKVLIRKDAQKTNAAQTNKNLLLSTGALADSIPALEINADDVKASHGSTIGQIDAQQLFYLRTRGLGLAAARSLLTFAFAREIVTRAPTRLLRAQLQELVLSRLPDGSTVREVLHETEA